MSEKNNNKATLSKKSISAIADQVEARIRQSDATPAPVTSRSDEPRPSSNRRFFWGAASGIAVALAVPLMGKQARPAIRSAIKGGLAAGRYVQRVASTVKEDVQDLAAEAKADLDKEGPQSSRTV